MIARIGLVLGVLLLAGCATLTPAQERSATEVRALAARTARLYGLPPIHLLVSHNPQDAPGSYRGGFFSVSTITLTSTFRDAIVAHELAHYVLGHEAPLHGASSGELERDYQQRELDANAKGRQREGSGDPDPRGRVQRGARAPDHVRLPRRGAVGARPLSPAEPQGTQVAVRGDRRPARPLSAAASVDRPARVRARRLRRRVKQNVPREIAAQILMGGAHLYGFTEADFQKADAAAAAAKQSAGS